LRPISLRGATTFPILPSQVSDCLDLKKPGDRLFDAAWRNGLSSIDKTLRCGSLCSVIGEVAEAVAEVLLGEHGYSPVYDLCERGVHGVDLLLLTPDSESVMAVEVKGTLRARSWPRLSGRRLAQMSVDWLNKSDNPGMVEWELEGADVYGAVVTVNLADMVWRVGFTSDFVTLCPVKSEAELASLEWVTG
jgi:hypothetical protein